MVNNGVSEKDIMGKRQLVILLTLLLVTASFGLAGNALAAKHVVSPGESLYKIAKLYDTSVNTLQKGNSLSGSSLYPGQVLWVPQYHYVSPGESLYLIGKKYGVHYSEIIRHNGLKNSSIYPGQKLFIPESNTTASRGSVSRLSPSDMDILARIITAEADSESFKTKVAVGAVVLNRVQSNLFPNSIGGVVYQVDEAGRYQFEPVLNGWINRPASRQAVLAAQEAIRGWDPTNGALYFWESWVKNSFLNKRPVSVVLDAFTFTW
jgi:LysM repeat protein